MLIAARAFVPPLLGLMGRVLSRLTGRSTTVLLAGRSASSAPGRSSSTTAALLIGVTLVSAVLIGAASLQRTIEQQTAEDTPVDLVVDDSSSQVESVLDDAPITQAHAAVPAARAEVTVADAPAAASGGDADAEAAAGLTGDLTVVSADDAEETVLRSDGFDVEEGTIRLAPADLGGEAATDEYADLEETVDVGGEVFTLTVEPSRDAPRGTALVSGEDAARIAGAAGAEATAQTWVRLADDAPLSQIEAVDSQLAALDVTTEAGPALLRALGFSRGAVGRMITTESLLMTVIALVVGVGLGVLFGWVGTASLIVDTATPVLSVPPIPLAVVAVAALVAAVLASAVPARSMSRVAPAQGLGQE